MTDYTELSDVQLKSERKILVDEIEHTKEQLTALKARLHEMTTKLTEKKQLSDRLQADMTAINAEIKTRNRK